jgi:hypothetical protein
VRRRRGSPVDFEDLEENESTGEHREVQKKTGQTFKYSASPPNRTEVRKMLLRKSEGISESSSSESSSPNRRLYSARIL